MIAGVYAHMAETTGQEMGEEPDPLASDMLELGKEPDPLVSDMLEWAKSLTHWSLVSDMEWVKSLTHWSAICWNGRRA